MSDSGTAQWQYLNLSSVELTNLAFGDFNGDGRADVFTADGSKWRISDSGAAGWRIANSSARQLADLRFGDFNADGQTDVFSAWGGRWYVSDSAAGQWRQINTSAVPVADLRLADFNGDGKSDVFAAWGGRWYVSYGGSGPWSQVNTSNYEVEDLAFADFDGDKKADVFRATGASWWISSAGTSSWKKINTSARRISDLRFGDVVGDDRIDVIHANGSLWYVSDGGSSPWSILNSSSATRDMIRLADFAGDGRDDVFTSQPAKTHELEVARHAAATIAGTAPTTGQVDAMFADANTTLRVRDRSGDVACRTRLVRKGSVEVFDADFSVVDSEERRDEIYDVDGNVKIINAVDYCNRYNLNTIGCGLIGDENLMIESAFVVDPRRGRLLAHEFGHNVGMSNLGTAMPNRLMNAIMDAGGDPALFNDVVQLNECVEFR